MQVPYRKPGKYALQKQDPMMTEGKFLELQKKLEGLKRARPDAAREVARLAELGDFSENVEYQLAKRKLRGINSGILKLERELMDAEIIRPSKNHGVVEVGSTVTVRVNNSERTYTILGSKETNPGTGVISQHSPIGNALLGKKPGDTVHVVIGKKEVMYQVISIA